MRATILVDQFGDSFCLEASSPFVPGRAFSLPACQNIRLERRHWRSSSLFLFPVFLGP